MRILSIETSCDETGVSLIDASGAFGPHFRFRVLGNALYSQAALHAQYGGVFPNLAKREHAKNLVPLLTETLRQADALRPSEMIYHIGDSQLDREPEQLEQNQEARLAQNQEARNENHDSGFLIPDSQLRELLAREPELLEQIVPFLTSREKPLIDAIAVTSGPGLEPALWVGINFAKALSIAWEMPLVAVNHMEGHVVLSMMDVDRLKSFDFPALALLISGGHTELVLSREFLRYERIGETRDDAAGEAFDKVARLLDLPYPGGPEISRLATEARAKSHESRIKFTPPMLNTKDYDFSFSGLKTEVRKLAEKRAPLTDEMKEDIALAFENAVTEVLVKKTVRAAEEHGASTVVVGGGVSANVFIRAQLKAALEGTGVQLLIPPPALATDNALMIALAGYFHAQRGEFSRPDEISASGNLKLENRA